MKKKIAVSIIGIAVSAIFLTACEASKGLETDDIKITQYKGVERLFLYKIRFKVENKL